MKENFSLTETAEIIGLSRQRTHQLYKEGAFPNAEMVGSTLIFKLSDIEEYRKATG